MSNQRTYRRNIFSRPEVGWNLFVAVVSLWATFRIPLDLVLSDPEWLQFPILDWLVVVVFVLDPVVSYRFSTLRGAHAANRYVRTLMPLDIIAAVMVFPAFNGTVLSLLGLLKLIHPTVFITSWRHQLLRRGNFLRMALFLYWMLVLIHLAASGWLYIRTEPIDAILQDEYIKALYWAATTLFTVGYGDIVPQSTFEMGYAMFVMMIGFLMMGYLVGNIAGLLNRPDPLRAQYSNALEEVSAFTQYHQLPTQLKHRIIDYFGYMWQQRSAFSDSNVLQMLPGGIRMEISLHLKRDVINRVPFFREADETFLREIANEMRSIVVTPGEYVFHAGDPASSMYFISRGDLEAIDDRGNLLGTLSDGDFFGEMALLENRRRGGSVRALDYCEVYELNAAAFSRIVEAHPDFRRHMSEIAQQRSSPN